MSGEPSRLPLQDADRVDQICDRFDAAWRAGGQPKIEDYLDVAPAAIRSALLQELLAAELDWRLRRGEQPVPSEYLGRFAGHSTVIGRALEDLGIADKSALDPHRTAGDVSTASLLWRLRTCEPTNPGLPDIPGYEVLDELGRGGMGVVYKARDLGLNRVVALKMILAGAHASPDARLRFLNEAEVVARLRHPNIVQVFGLGDHEGRPFVELEYIEGGNLARALDGTPRPAAAAAELVEVLARAVQAAHSRGIIHRDLKPANVLLTSEGEPKIADFGLAKAVDSGSDLTGTDVILGSPSYMAPEQAEGAASSTGPAADVYALGAIFYELLAGRPPFKAASVLETLEQVRTTEPVAPSRLQPGLPRDAETICLKCLRKDPAQRYHTALELADDLRRWLDGEPVIARPVGRVGRIWRWCVREPKVAGLIAALALVFLGGFAGVFWQWRRAETQAYLARSNAEAERLAREKSEANFRSARALVENLGDVARAMSSQPALEKTRREILEKILEFQLRFLNEKSNDVGVIYESAKAFVQVGRTRVNLQHNAAAGEAYRRAAALYARLLNLAPGNAEYQQAAAWCHFWTGLYEMNVVNNFADSMASLDKASKAFQKLIADHPDADQYQADLAITLTNWAAFQSGRGDREEAARLFPRIIEIQRSLVEKAPNNPQNVRHLAISLAEQGSLLAATDRAKDAEAAFRESIDLMQALVKKWPIPTGDDVYLARHLNYLANILARRGRLTEANGLSRRAFEALEKFVVAFPDRSDVRTNFAETALAYGGHLESLSRHDESTVAFNTAVAQYRKLATDFPDSPTHLNGWAWVLVSAPRMGARDHERAIELATRAVGLSSNNPDFWNTLGVAQYRAGHFSSAKTSLEKAVALRSGGITDDWIFLAMTCWKLSDRAQARAWYARAADWVKRNPNGKLELLRFRAEADSLFSEAKTP